MQLTPRFTTHLIATALAALPLCAQADEPSAWTLSGYGTLGLVHAGTRDADFTNTVLKVNGAGYTRSWSANVDSRLGAQIDHALDKQWSAVLQVVAEQGVDGSYRPHVEWFNIKYQVTPDLSVRLGRIALPIFLAADYRKAGYAYPWARTPVELYDAIPISNSDGIDATYRWRTGDVKHVTQAFLGATDIKITDYARAKARTLAGISHTVELGAASARLSLMRADLNVDLVRPLFDGFRQFGPQGVAIAEKYDVVNKRAEAISFGANYDPGEFFLMGEIGRLNARSYLGDKVAMYATGGYRIGGFTPYLAYAHVWSKGQTSDAGLTTTGMPPPVAAAAGALNAGLNSILMTIAVQTTRTAGVRWDLARNMALKLQYDQVTPALGSTGTLLNAQPTLRGGQSINVTSVVLDFVF
jgi:hypothetical protein